MILTQHLSSSLSISDRPVHRLRKRFVLSQPDQCESEDAHSSCGGCKVIHTVSCGRDVVENQYQKYCL